jgi:hypothetical protein
MGKLTLKELAQQAALRGDVDAAMTQLNANLAAGDHGAHASLAELAAFRGQWSDVLAHAYAFLRNPLSAYAGNVFADVANLVALAGIKREIWPDVASEVTAIRAHLVADPKLARYAERLDQLLALARSGGTSPYVWDWANHSALDEDARTAKVDAAIAELNKKKKPFKDETARKRHLFSLAYTFGSYPAAARLYDENGHVEATRFNEVAFTASALSRAGRSEDAWKVVESCLPMWWPVDSVQVAPVVLLTDEGLRTLMTPDRCELVLRTPRGEEATTKK